MAEASDLADDCWESILKILKDDESNKHNCHINSLSLVSKKFLSITGRLQSSLNVKNPTNTRLFPHGLHQRFPNLSSLQFSGCRYDLNKCLHQLSRFPLNITSLNLSHHPITPVHGLRAFSQNNKALTSLKCLVDSFNNNDLFLIAECFPFLQELDLSPRFKFCNNLHDGIETLSMKLFKLRKINLSYHSYMNDRLLYCLFKNCKLLQDVIILGCYSITIAGLTSALVEAPTLRSLSFTHDSRHFANLFALVTNHPSLTYIIMDYTYPLTTRVENSNTSMDFAVTPQLKSLCLSYNTWLSDENILVFASIFPNLQLLDLSHCEKISESICHVLNMCCKIRHLNLANCSNVKLLGMNFEAPNLESLNLSHCSNVKQFGINFKAPKLEWLNLSHTNVNNETLHLISKSCPRLLHLLLENCFYVTKIGVNHVVENCTQLREINLEKCSRVNSKVVYQMTISRPSLRKIIDPKGSCFNMKDGEVLSIHSTKSYSREQYTYQFEGLHSSELYGCCSNDIFKAILEKDS